MILDDFKEPNVKPNITKRLRVIDFIITLISLLVYMTDFGQQSEIKTLCVIGLFVAAVFRLQNLLKISKNGKENK